MSKYRIVKADFKTPDSLIRALNDLKVEYQRGADLRRNEATLRTNWSGIYGGENQPVAVAIDRDALAKSIGSRPMDGCGFAWNGSGYDFIQDQHDTGRPDVQAWVNRLRQRYSFWEVQRLAHARGYNVRESYTQDGQINITLVRR
jgi:hypothetical protein